MSKARMKRWRHGTDLHRLDDASYDRVVRNRRLGLYQHTDGCQPQPWSAAVIRPTSTHHSCGQHSSAEVQRIEVRHVVAHDNRRLAEVVAACLWVLLRDPVPAGRKHKHGHLSHGLNGPPHNMTTHTPKMNRITRTSHRAGASRAVRKHPMACVRPPTTGRNPHVASFVSSQASNKQTVTRTHNRSHQVRHPLAAAQVVSAASWPRVTH